MKRLERYCHVLRGPHHSEKSTMVEAKNQYVFKVAPDATKEEIKQAMEYLFEVKVKAVNFLNMKGKSVRTGRFEGRRSDWKKAYVTLFEGHELRLFDPT